MFWEGVTGERNVSHRARSRELASGPDPQRMPGHVTIACPKRLTKPGLPEVRIRDANT